MNLEAKRALISLPAAGGALAIAEPYFRFGAFVPEALACIGVYLVLVGTITAIFRLAGAITPRWTMQGLAVKPPAVAAGLVGTQAFGELGSFTREMIVFFFIYLVTALVLDLAVTRLRRVANE